MTSQNQAELPGPLTAIVLLNYLYYDNAMPSTIWRLVTQEINQVILSLLLINNIVGLKLDLGKLLLYKLLLFANRLIRQIYCRLFD